MKYILALDQGTTGNRAFLFDEKLEIAGQAYQEFEQHFPKPGWVEHDADEIYRSLCEVISNVIDESGIDKRDIAAIGITNQRETTVIWDRATSRPIHHAIVWQCRRTEDICRELSGASETVHQKTGLVVDPYFSGTKIKWLLDQVPGAKQRAQDGKLCFGTIDTWLIWKMTGGQVHVTDYTNASRTMLLNIQSKKWDTQLLQMLDIPPSLLPDIQPSGGNFGETRGTGGGLPDGIPIMSVLGDQQAASYGQGCFSPGTMKNTYGTGCFLVLNTGDDLVYSKKGLLSTLVVDVQGNPVYALEGAIFTAGAVIQWLRDQLGIIRTASETEEIIKGLKSTDGVYIVPAFSGLGAPYWDSAARGLIVGLTRGSSKAHLVRAALEAIAYQTKDVFDVMVGDLGRPVKELQVDGGACGNDFLMQFQADMLGCTIRRPKMAESTVRGVAALAGVSLGWWKDEQELLSLMGSSKTFQPRMSARERDALYAGWVKAVLKAKSGK